MPESSTYGLSVEWGSLRPQLLSWFAHAGQELKVGRISGPRFGDISNVTYK